MNSGPGNQSQQVENGRKYLRPHWFAFFGAWGTRLLAGALRWICGITLVLWLIGRIVSDRYSWSQWLLWIPSQAAVLAAGLGLLTVLLPAARNVQAKTLRRRRLMRWAAVAAAILVFFACIEHRFWRVSPPSPDASALRIVHWNLNHRPQVDPDAVLQFLLAQDADVVVLTDAGPAARSALVTHAALNRLATASHGALMFVSRLPIIGDAQRAGATDIWYLLVELDAQSKLGGHVTLGMIDLPSEPAIPRMKLARKVREIVERIEQQPQIVVGDFNMTRSSASLATVFPGMRHAFTQAGSGYGASFPRSVPYVHIDHVLLNSEFQARRYELIDAGISRHRAQVVEIQRTETN